MTTPKHCPNCGKEMLHPATEPEFCPRCDTQPTPKRRTLEEIADEAMLNSVRATDNMQWCNSVKTVILAALREAADAAAKDRDFEWWQALVLVDNVDPTPEAAKTWLLHLAKYEQDVARQEERLKWQAETLKEKRRECE